MPYTLRQRLAAFINPSLAEGALRDNLHAQLCAQTDGHYKTLQSLKTTKATLRQAVRYYGQAVARWDNASANWEAADVKQHRKHIKRLRKVAGL